MTDCTTVMTVCCGEHPSARGLVCDVCAMGWLCSKGNGRCASCGMAPELDTDDNVQAGDFFEDGRPANCIGVRYSTYHCDQYDDGSFMTIHRPVKFGCKYCGHDHDTADCPRPYWPS